MKMLTVNDKISHMLKVYEDLRESQPLADLLEVCKKNISRGFIFSGVGKNWYIAEKVNKTFISMGLKSEALDCVHALHGDLGMVKDQFVFFISKSGTTKEMIDLVKVMRGLRSNGVKSPYLVGLFLNSNIPDKELFDCLITPSEAFKSNEMYEFDERNLIPSLSINILMMILDEFGVEVFESHPDLVEAYKYNHMGGSNGKKLGTDKLLSKFDNE